MDMHTCAVCITIIIFMPTFRRQHIDIIYYVFLCNINSTAVFLSHMPIDDRFIHNYSFATILLYSHYTGVALYVLEPTMFNAKIYMPRCLEIYCECPMNSNNKST